MYNLEYVSAYGYNHKANSAIQNDLSIWSGGGKTVDHNGSSI